MTVLLLNMEKQVCVMIALWLQYVVLTFTSAEYLH